MDLNQIRQEIDKIDEQIKQLFLKRMELSHQVIEAKKVTGAKVYAPKRESEIIRSRSANVPEEYRLACQTFFQQLMELSRTYQYSHITEQTDALKNLPQKEGSFVLTFDYPLDGRQLAAAVAAAAFARLTVEQIKTEESKAGIRRCQIRLSGDCSKRLSKAAVLQILSENQNGAIL